MLMGLLASSLSLFKPSNEKGSSNILHTWALSTGYEIISSSTEWKLDSVTLNIKWEGKKLHMWANTFTPV